MRVLVVAAVIGATCAVGARGQTHPRALPGVVVTVDRNFPAATREFKFPRVPSPVKDDAAAGPNAKVTIVDGVIDDNSAPLGVITDGLLPREEDEPGSNFFFNAGTSGGSFRIDLGAAIDVAEVRSYSWHPNTRGPQVYALFGADGTAAGFNVAPKGETEPAAVGWTPIAIVDTRRPGDDGGQYGVQISHPSGSLGKYRYLLFVCSATEMDDDWGNTFYSEIDVIAKNAGGS